MSKLFYNFIFLLTILVTLSAFLFFFNTEWYRYLIQEDGVLENITALILLFGSFLAMSRIRKFDRKKHPWRIVLYVFLSLGLLFAFGEEISWGQRIFNTETPEFFSENNLQKETNIHNLEFNGIKFNRVFSIVMTIGFSIYFLLFLPLYQRQLWISQILDRFGVPVPRIHHSILIILSTLVIVSIPDSKIWEIWECAVALILFLTLYYPFNESAVRSIEKS